MLGVGKTAIEGVETGVVEVVKVADDVKDGVNDAVDKVGDFGGEAVGAVTDFGKNLFGKRRKKRSTTLRCEISGFCLLSFC